MVLDFKLLRTGSGPWGFRLTGGADFEQPLKVTKIMENSVAEECGLKVGDTVVRINDVDITNMSHHMVHELIIGFSDSFVVGVEREDDIDCATENPKNGVSPIDFNAYESHSDRPGSGMYSEISVNSAADSITAELEASKITEEHIAEIMSGEAEVLKDHNVIGVNFQKIMPKANIFKSSEVFKHLNEEAMKTRSDKEKEVKRWTTFLQKPNRPIPKPKSEIDKPYHEPYRVRIVKQPKPACDPKQVPTPTTLSGHGIDTVQTNSLNETPAQTNTELVETVDQSLAANINELNATIENKLNETIDTTDIDDDDVPSLLVCKNTDEFNESEADDSAGKLEMNCSGNTDELIEIERNPNEDNVPNEIENQLVTENPELEKQLANVQKQLEALSHLPSTIQATLEAVTKQIAEIMPAFKIRTSIDITGSIDKESSIKITEEFDAKRDVTQENDHIRETTENEIITTDSNTNDVTFKEHSHATLELCTNEPTTPESPSIESESIKLQCQPMPDMIEVLASNADEQVTKLKIEKVYKEQEEKWIREREQTIKAQKEEQRKTIAESAAKNAKNAKSNNGPRTPQERPVVLPGGRKWRNPKDAYNEEFIAEIISSQAELITGSTLGINFLKYKKPEKDLSNLNRSEVLKLIHNNDGGSITGISERPEKLYAADDYVGHP